MWLLKSREFGIGLAIVLLISAGGFILRRATDNANTQTITVQDGGTATINTSVTERERNWSLGGYIEKSTRGEEVIFGATVEYRF